MTSIETNVKVMSLSSLIIDVGMYVVVIVLALTQSHTPMWRDGMGVEGEHSAGQPAYYEQTTEMSVIGALILCDIL